MIYFYQIYVRGTFALWNLNFFCATRNMSMWQLINWTGFLRCNKHPLLTIAFQPTFTKWKVGVAFYIFKYNSKYTTHYWAHSKKDEQKSLKKLSSKTPKGGMFNEWIPEIIIFSAALGAGTSGIPLRWMLDSQFKKEKKNALPHPCPSVTASSCQTQGCDTGVKT